ncbi:energy-coupling factor transporter transmembrane component T family protein [Hominifimenecus sp. rT4P-3]|uniref:energy-coupling factor transporter transmembrane component T family protein n=1 Tax=Hominifimenecus sp. rT4P-3 TaxID=3242979 RepID=UPI003DA41DBC
MLRDITLGQYYPVASPIHRLDPRTKLMGTLVFLISLFVADSWYCYLLATVFLGACIRISRVPLSFILRGLKAVIFLLLFSVVFNLFLTDGDVLVRFWIFKITKQGLLQAGYMAIRLIYLIMGSSLMTFTTTPTSLTDGLERGLGFLKIVKVPVHEIAMMMSIALRFIPILTEEADKIMKAQMARGADFESGSLIQRAKSLIPLLVPLFISAFRRAADLAMAMEARCYRGGEGRTKMHPLKYAGRDGVAYGLLAGYLGIMIVLKVSIVI